MITTCKQCGKTLEQTSGRRAKQFCNSTCRSKYWYKGTIHGHKVQVDEPKVQIMDATKPIPHIKPKEQPKVDKATEHGRASEEAILKQIAAIKAETIPDLRNKSDLGRKSWKLEQQKRIDDLKKQLK